MFGRDLYTPHKFALRCGILAREACPLQKTPTQAALVGASYSADNGHLVPGGKIKWIDRLGSTPEMEPEALIAKRGRSK